MIIAVSGYNAAGKSTVVSHLRQQFEREGIQVSVKRFSDLYPGSYIGKKLPERNPKVAADGTMGLRSLEAQRGDWNQTLNWSKFANLLAASMIARFFALRNRRRVILFDRFLYDRFVHFDPNHWRMRIAKACFYRPSVTLILLPELEAHEKRFLHRAKNRHGIELERMSDADRKELEMVHRRYREIADGNGECVTIDTSDPTSLQQAWDVACNRLPSRMKRIKR